jgi:hypothetical protein
MLHVEYKSGEQHMDPDTVHSILFYGSICPLGQDVLDECTRKFIPIIYHRRNLSVSTWITNSFLTDTKNDILEKQIMTRTNEKKRAYIIRRLLDAKFKSMGWLIGYPQQFSKRWLDPEEMQAVESQHARKYWQEYFLNVAPGETRRGKSKYTQALDAVSKFIEGILIRWITFHRLSPFHGFLHRPESYTALVYDLMEPYRGYVERHLYEHVFLPHRSLDGNALTACALDSIKAFMKSVVYVHATRQEACFQELYHGAVLALRAYLLKRSVRLVIPVPGVRNGGRPVQSGYRLYGREAGPVLHEPQRTVV